jgi:hypothetical protein
MNDLLIPNVVGGKAPLVDFRISGELKIEGRSIIENPVGFYKPVLQWLDEYKELNPALVIMSINLEYFNTSTSKLLIIIFKALESFRDNGSEIKIIWLYSDQDMLESGMDYESIINVPFELVEAI